MTLQLPHIGGSKIYSLTIQLHHVKVSTKSSKIKINKNFSADLDSSLYATKEATVARSNRKHET